MLKARTARGSCAAPSRPWRRPRGSLYFFRRGRARPLPAAWRGGGRQAAWRPAGRRPAGAGKQGRPQGGALTWPYLWEKYMDGSARTYNKNSRFWKNTEKSNHKKHVFCILGIFMGLVGPLGGWLDRISCYIRGMGPQGWLCHRFWNYFHF